MQERNDDFNQRRKHIKDLSDHELKQKFLELADELVDPFLDLAYENTSKSIERSVLLRMGFSSLEAKGIVDQIVEVDLLSKGAGHCVYKLAKEKEMSIKDAGLKIAEGKHLDYLQERFDSHA